MGGTLSHNLNRFGISKPSTPTASHTIQQMQGTPAFLSPENLTAKDNSPAGVYAFSGMLVELFSKIPIWEGLTPFQVITKVVDSRYQGSTPRSAEDMHALL